MASECLTYALVHSECLLNGLLEERDSVMCETGEEAKASISKSYLCINAKLESLGMSSVCRALLEARSELQIHLGIGYSIKSGPLTEAGRLRCLSYHSGMRSRRFSLGWSPR